ncbi:MAG: protein kinase [Gammaproteobacteria bacterium]|nr:protein kinase [Gammaproteobacteria bacterium]
MLPSFVLMLKAGGRLAGDRFVLVRALGEGGLGQVWLAQDTRDDRRVALKILADTYARHPGAIELLKREFARQQTLSHPHVLEAYELVAEDDTLILVMQYAAGGDARQLRGASWQRLVPVLMQVAEALAHAHAQGVVHRDVKSANVLLDDAGQARLADFGHAMRLDGDASDALRGGGTVATMSPQQLDGEKPAPSDDLYAFGVLCFELLSGELPLGETPDVASVRTRPPPSLGSRAKGLPASLVELVDALLAKSPAARPDLGQVKQRLGALQAQARKPPADEPSYPLSTEGETDGAGADEDIAITARRPRRRRGGQVVQGDSAGPGAPSASASGSGRASAADRAGPGPAQAPRAWSTPRFWTGLAFTVLLALLLATVFWLPQRSAPSGVPVTTMPGDDADPSAVAAPEPAPSPREEPAAAREQAEVVLGRLVTVQSRLTPLRPSDWAGEDWRTAQALGEQGDDLLLARRFSEAATAFGEALERLEEVESRIPALYDEAMTAGAAALRNEDQAGAIEAYSLAAQLRPDDAQAQAALARAQQLDEVLALMSDGRRAQERGELAAARNAFSAALEIDAQWQPAREALARIERQQAEQAFSAVLSRGFAALAEERFRDAVAAFEEALARRPDAADARDGLAQAVQGQRLQQIRLAQVRAIAFERQERWEEALTQYRAALEIDETLGFAREGRTRSQARASLDAKLEALLATPARLFDDRVLAEAQGLAEEARETFDAEGGQKLQAQVQRLESMLALATQPIDVELRSDGLTEVRVFRVGEIGSFERTTLQLRPGDYTIIGSRDGYRDVRRTLSLRPGRSPEPVTIICTDRI